MKPLRVAVVGAGTFGRNHARAIRDLAGVELSAIVDVDPSRAAELAALYQTRGLHRLSSLKDSVDAAIVATPTLTHEAVTAELLEAGIDVLVEKPIAPTAKIGARLAELALDRQRILQVGHLERFNPAVTALEAALTIPLFFEIHRLSVFTPRSLDIDVVLDLMIHDLDIILQFTRETPSEIRASGISVLSKRVDIANVRLAFPGGCIANLTASRVSTEKVRKLRLFQPGQYISLDYGRQDAVCFRVNTESGAPGIGFEPLAVSPGEPLKLELQSFFQSVRERTTPRVDGRAGTAALEVAEAIVREIAEHGKLVTKRLQA